MPTIVNQREEESKDLVLPEGMPTTRAKKPKEAETMPSETSPTKPEEGIPSIDLTAMSEQVSLFVQN